MREQQRYGVSAVFFFCKVFKPQRVPHADSTFFVLLIMFGAFSLLPEMLMLMVLNP